MKFDDYLQEQLKDPEFKREYDALGPKYELIIEVLRARNEQNLTQADLARMVNTRQSNISRFESGESNPSLRFMQKIAHALGKELSVTLR